MNREDILAAEQDLVDEAVRCLMADGYTKEAAEARVARNRLTRGNTLEGLIESTSETRYLNVQQQVAFWAWPKNTRTAVDRDGTVRVWDNVANHYVRSHDEDFNAVARNAAEW